MYDPRTDESNHRRFRWKVGIIFMIGIYCLFLYYSGAGKTVSAKYIMRYFATADDQESVGKKKKTSGSGMTEVEEQILGKFLSEKD